MTGIVIGTFTSGGGGAQNVCFRRLALERKTAMLHFLCFEYPAGLWQPALFDPNGDRSFGVDQVCCRVYGLCQTCWCARQLMEAEGQLATSYHPRSEANCAPPCVCVGKAAAAHQLVQTGVRPSGASYPGAEDAIGLLPCS